MQTCDIDGLDRIARFADGDLIGGLKNALARQNHETAWLIAFIAEVDARGLYRDHGYSSMFEYAVRALHMSEGEAFPRIAAGRLIRKYPRVLGMLSRGELHLSGIRLAGPELTPENHSELLDAIRFKSKREIECILAARCPKPDVSPEIRKLPQRALVGPTAPARIGVLEPASERAEPSRKPALRSSLMSAAVGIASAAASTQTNAAVSSSAATRDAVSADVPNATLPASPTEDLALRPAIGRPTSVMQPLSADRYKVQFTASQGFRDKLEQARHLFKQQVPDGDLAEIFERALDLLIAEELKRRFAVGRKRRAREVFREPVEASDGSQTARDGSRPESRHIPHEVRRGVLARDQGRCTFVSLDGQRCEQRGALQFHHKEPYARGGQATFDNIALLCGPHNALRAERDFGRTLIQRRVDEAVAARARDRLPRGKSVAGAVAAEAAVSESAPPEQAPAMAHGVEAGTRSRHAYREPTQ